VRACVCFLVVVPYCAASVVMSGRSVVCSLCLLVMDVVNSVCHGWLSRPDDSKCTCLIMMVVEGSKQT